ncbi:hypothetical protein ACH5RR_010429 [Cinchona calisaya]|uniref:Uncharacterized protein n=1 Tax=Cinchona calisaya TaxID=153742 RepID=A0ABD3AIX1_9GENT
MMHPPLLEMVPERSSEAADHHPRRRHILAVPYPGRGHINAMLNLCKIIASNTTHRQLLITFVLTEEWFGFIGSDPKPSNIRFATIPNVIPSELVRAANMRGFFEAIQTKMPEPIEELLDRIQIEAPVAVIISEVFLKWAVDVGRPRNIPVALLWPMSAAAFSIFYHFDLISENGHFPFDLPAKGEEIVDYIPGIPSIRLADLPTVLHKENFDQILATFANIQRAQYLLFTSIYELEPQIINAIKPKFLIPLYSLGPLIPHFNLGQTKSSSRTKQEEQNYFEWLDAQTPNSVLYVSMGSFLSASNTQTDEIAAGLRDSGVSFLWVARGDTSRLKEICGPSGMLVHWCEQLEVLCHPSVGGFWTHCGWNSTMESVFAGVPMLTFPIVIDQLPNSKLIVEDWKVGWRVKRVAESMPTREEIADLVRRFMSFNSQERKEMMARVIKLRDIPRRALKEGSSGSNLISFLAHLGI